MLHTFACNNRDSRTRKSGRERKPVARTQSAPHRRPGHNRYAPRRQTSTEDLQMNDAVQDHETEAAHPLDISSPQTVSVKHQYKWQDDVRNYAKKLSSCFRVLALSQRLNQFLGSNTITTRSASVKQRRENNSTRWTGYVIFQQLLMRDLNTHDNNPLYCVAPGFAMAACRRAV